MKMYYGVKLGAGEKVGNGVLLEAPEKALGFIRYKIGPCGFGR